MLAASTTPPLDSQPRCQNQRKSVSWSSFIDIIDHCPKSTGVHSPTTLTTDYHQRQQRLHHFDGSSKHLLGIKHGPLTAGCRASDQS
eukprot:14603341-Alexandrium_andersonii.AAC.1